MTTPSAQTMLELADDLNKAAHAAGTNAWVRDVLRRAHRVVSSASQPAAHVPEIVDHHYSPDYQAMGDCQVCGHEQNKPWHIGQAPAGTGGDDPVRLAAIKVWAAVERTSDHTEWFRPLSELKTALALSPPQAPDAVREAHESFDRMLRKKVIQECIDVKVTLEGGFGGKSDEYLRAFQDGCHAFIYAIRTLGPPDAGSRE